MLYYFLLALFLFYVRATEYVVHAPDLTHAQLVSSLTDTEIKLQRAVGVPGWFVISAPDDANHPHLHDLRSSGSLAVMSELVELKRKTRSSDATDPWLRDAWYLTGLSHFGHSVPITVNATHVWDDYDGKGVSICIVDDAVSTSHKDLKHAFDAKRSRSMCGRDTVDPPTSSYKHGTAAAAVAVAQRDNGVCGAGVAPGATLGAVRLLSCRMNDANEATALSYKCDAPKHERNDIFSSSWGPYDDGKHIEGPGVATRAAMEHCIEHGRDGKGSIYIVAGGNGNREKDSVGWDGYASSLYTIAVGAIANEGVAAWYSEWGAGLLVSVGSSGGSTGRYSNVATSAYRSYDDEACDWFGGTSAACPQVAGLVALMLEARPDLTWRDVQHVLVHAAKIVDPDNAIHPWVTNKAGFTHSNQYGFGLVTAPNVLREALDWELVGPWKHQCSTPREAHHTEIKQGEIASFTLAVRPPVSKMEHVRMHVDMDFDYAISDLGRIRLTSPQGTSNLISGANKQRSKRLDWTFDSVRFWGENPSGSWTILVENSGRHSLYLNSVSLCFYGE